VTEALLLARGFTVDEMAELVRAGLATATTDNGMPRTGCAIAHDGAVCLLAKTPREKIDNIKNPRP
jgi:hypothetical protein